MDTPFNPSDYVLSFQQSGIVAYPDPRCRSLEEVTYDAKRRGDAIGDYVNVVEIATAKVVASTYP